MEVLSVSQPAISLRGDRKEIRSTYGLMPFLPLPFAHIRLSSVDMQYNAAQPVRFVWTTFISHKGRQSNPAKTNLP